MKSSLSQERSLLLMMPIAHTGDSRGPRAVSVSPGIEKLYEATKSRKWKINWVAWILEWSAISPALCWLEAAMGGYIWGEVWAQICVWWVSPRESQSVKYEVQAHSSGHWPAKISERVRFDYALNDILYYSNSVYLSALLTRVPTHEISQVEIAKDLKVFLLSLGCR